MRQSLRAGKLLLLLAQLRPDCGSIGQWWGGPCVPHCTTLYHVLYHCTTHCNWLLPREHRCFCGAAAAACVRVYGVWGPRPVPRATSHHHWICWIHVSILCLCSVLCVARQAGAYFWHPIVIYSTINETGAGTVTSLYTANQVWCRYFGISKNVSMHNAMAYSSLLVHAQ